MAKVIRFDVPVVFRLQEDTDCFYDHKPSWKFYEPCTRCMHFTSDILRSGDVM